MTKADSTGSPRPKLSPGTAFVVHLGPDIDATAGTVVGRVEHVLSGRAARFGSSAELLEFMQRTLVEQGVADPAAEQNSGAMTNARKEEL